MNAIGFLSRVDVYLEQPAAALQLKHWHHRQQSIGRHFAILVVLIALGLHLCVLHGRRVERAAREVRWVSWRQRRVRHLSVNS